ncbi:MAG: SAM-dependent methyltransferase [Flavihumibacter sp.]
MAQPGTVWLIPCYLSETSMDCLPAYILPAIQQCAVFFTENERTARRYLKKWWKEMVIDHYEWHTIGQAEAGTLAVFRQRLKEGKTIGILSEAGCPGVADPGQLLVAAAQELSAPVKPLVGPSSLLLALMASGMNGQQFRFLGYLPIEAGKRNAAIKELEADSLRTHSTQIFIETPYRNRQLFETLLQQCRGNTRLCVAVNLTAPDELVQTKTIADWKKQQPDWQKKPAIFLLQA